jgi:subtilase family serine protease
MKKLTAFIFSFYFVYGSQALSDNLDPVGLNISDAVSLVYVLKTKDEAGLEAYIKSISEPGSPNYGGSLTLSQLRSRYGSSTKSSAKVISYLKARGLSPEADGLGVAVRVNTNVAVATQLTKTRLVRKTSSDSGNGVITLDAPDKVDPELSDHIERVLVKDTQGASKQPIRNPRVASNGNVQLITAQLGVSPPSQYLNGGQPVSCPQIINNAIPTPYAPNQWLSAYGVDVLHSSGLRGQGQRVALVEGDGYSSNQIQLYANCFGLPLPSISVTNISGGVTPPPPNPAYNSETNLDLSVLMAVAPELDGIDIYNSVDGNGYQLNSPDDYAQAISLAISKPKGARPTIISMSTYYACEVWGLQSSAVSLEKVFKRAAALGIPVFAATGDTGSTSCRINSNNYDTAAAVTSVQYPSSSTWVTAVGGTSVSLSPNNSLVSEVTWNDWGLYPLASITGEALYSVDIGSSTGGFSNWYQIPSWQNVSPLVSVYYSPTLQSISLKAPGRMLPDISMLADSSPGYDIPFVDPTGAQCPVGSVCGTATGGTSAAAPFAAGITALVNQGLKSSGHKSIGFLNPSLYKIGNSPSLYTLAMNDVQSGNNYTGWQTSLIALTSTTASLVTPVIGEPVPGFNAGPGYDLATGWGSLKAPGFLEVMKKLQ